MNAPPGGARLPRSARALCLFSFLALSALAIPQRCHAQDPGADVTFTRQPLFRIPFQTDPNERRIKQVWLYVSNDQGRTWHPNSNVRPEEGAFMFNAPKDGLYWFTVRTVDLDDRAFPLKMEAAKPGLKVIVDSTPPTITLRPLAARDGQVGVEWDVQEDKPDLTTVALESRPQSGGDWVALRPDPSLNGSHYFQPTTAGTLEVRLRLRDRAGNEGLGRTIVQGTQQQQSPPPATNDVASTPSVPVSTAVRMVNNKRFNLNYEVTEVGKSGISAVELWMTPDGRSWTKFSEQKR
jgi:hypothetical protein